MQAKNVVSIEIMFPLEIWKQIIGEYVKHKEVFNRAVLALAIVNKGFREVIKQNLFWSTCVNKYYEHATFPIYDSIVDFVNISHILYSFLDYEKYKDDAMGILSNKQFFLSDLSESNARDEIETFTNVISHREYKWRRDPIVEILYDNEFISICIQKGSNESKGSGDEESYGGPYESYDDRSYEEEAYPYHNYENETCYDNKARDYRAIWIHNKFLRFSRNDKNRHLKVLEFYISDHKKVPHHNCCSLTIHGNYIWICINAGDSKRFYAHDIFALETNRVDYYYEKISKKDKIKSFWQFCHCDDGLLTLRKIVKIEK